MKNLILGNAGAGAGAGAKPSKGNANIIKNRIKQGGGQSAANKAFVRNNTKLFSAKERRAVLGAKGKRGFQSGGKLK